MTRRDYIVVGDPDYPEEIHATKRAAIRAAKNMARITNNDAMVIPCVDGYANDSAPYYVVTPKCEIIEK